MNKSGTLGLADELLGVATSQMAKAQNVARFMSLIISNHYRDGAALAQSRLGARHPDGRSLQRMTGTRNDLTFYSRCNFVPKPNGTMHCVYLEYPEREERAWDGIVTRISRSLGAPDLNSKQKDAESP